MKVNNFEIHHKAIETLSIVDVVRIVDYVDELSTFIHADNEVLDYLEDVVSPFMSVIDQCITNEECPQCGCYLFRSNSPQYTYVCAECNEKF